MNKYNVAIVTAAILVGLWFSISVGQTNVDPIVTSLQFQSKLGQCSSVNANLQLYILTLRAQIAAHEAEHEEVDSGKVD